MYMVLRSVLRLVTVPAGAIFRLMTTTSMEAGIDVQGILNMASTPSQKIYFTSWRDADPGIGGDIDGESPNVNAKAGDWGSLRIATVEGLTPAAVHDCVFRYGGGNGSSTSSSSTRGALRVYGASPEVRDNVFEHNYFGIELYDSSSVVNNNTVTGSTYNPVIQVATSFPSYNGNTYTGNGRQAIRIAGRIDGNGTWDKDENLPFYIETAHSSNNYVYGVEISSTAVVTVPAGAIFRLMTTTSMEAGIDVQGILNMASTPSQKVYFTSWRDADPAIGGDIDGESPNVNAKAGDWGSLRIATVEGLTPAAVHDCVFRYGGGNGSSTSSSSTRGALRVYGASPEVRDNVFEHNYFGIELYDSSSVVNNNTVTGSTYNPVIQVATSFPSYNGNTYTGNGRQAIRVAGRIDGNGTWDKDENLPFYIETAHSRTTMYMVLRSVLRRW